MALKAYDDALARLSPRQRACLRMVASHYSTKEIARELSISEHTVRGYLAESKRALGASDLHHASRLFLEASESDPLFLGGQIDRVATDAPAQAATASQEKIEPAASSSEAAARPTKAEKVPFHFLRGERRSNDLSLRQRVIWIMVVSIIVPALLATSIFLLNMIAKLAVIITHLH